MGLTKQAMFDEEERLNRWRERWDALVADGTVPPDHARDVRRDLGECIMCEDDLGGDTMSEWLDTVENWAKEGRVDDNLTPANSLPSRCDHCRHVMEKDD